MELNFKFEESKDSTERVQCSNQRDHFVSRKYGFSVKKRSKKVNGQNIGGNAI